MSCVDEEGVKYLPEKCLEQEDLGPQPNDTRPCAVVIPCEYQWHASQWGEVSENILFDIIEFISFLGS